tara:strand:- start:448 stop:666 length:219 start_codon:yes stop_codon:yes gene_type:complete
MKKKKGDIQKAFDSNFTAQSYEIGPGHGAAKKGQKIYNKGKGSTNPNEKETFLKRTGPQLPLAKRKIKKKYG